MDIFYFSRNKLLSTNILDNVRMTRGFVTYINFGFRDFLFGIGDMLREYTLNNIHLEYVSNAIDYNTEHLLGYTTSASGVFIKTGFVSGLLYLKLLLTHVYVRNPYY